MSLDQTALQAKRFGVFTCENCVNLADAVRLMVAEDISALVITDPDGSLIGVLSRTDILRAAITAPDWRIQSVRAFMSRDVVTVPPEATLREAAEILLDRRIHRVVVVRDEDGRPRPVSIISDADIVYHLSKEG